MNKKEFGKLVAALRKEKLDESLLFWTQKKLGDESGLGEIVVGKIERGQKSTFEQETLVRLADALQLTSMERKEFLFAALGVEDKQVVRKQEDIDSFLTPLIEQVGTLRYPSFIHDSYGDIVAINKSIAELYQFSDQFIEEAQQVIGGVNIMNLVFADHSPFKTVLGNRWREVALHNLQYFRRITLQKRGDDYFDALFKLLNKNSQFRRLWQDSYFEEGDRNINTQEYEYRHTELGSVHYLAVISTAVSPFGALYLTIYLPMDDQTVVAFDQLWSRNKGALIKLNVWPRAEH